MNENQKKVYEALSLPEEEYYNLSRDTKRKVDTAIADALRADSFFTPVPEHPIYVLKGPTEIELGKRESIPVFLASQENGLRRWQVSRKLNTHLVLVDRMTGKVASERFADDPPGKRMPIPPPSQSGSKPNESGQKSVTTGILPINLQPYFNYSSVTNRYSATVILYDEASTTHTFTLITDGTSNSNTASAGVQASTFVHDLKTIEKQAEYLISHQYESAGDKGASEIEFSLSLPETDLTILPGIEDGKKVLPISVLFFKLDEEMPEQVDAFVSLREEFRANGRIALSGTINTEQALDGKSMSGQYQSYIIAGGAVSSAVAIEF